MDSQVIGRAEVEQVLREAVSEDVQLINYQLVPFEKKVGFNGDHSTLTVQYVANNADENQRVNFFVKLVPKNEFQRNFMLERGMFSKEEEAYFNLLPIMEKALGQKLPVAKCYMSSYEKYLIFEDLSQKGYTLADKLPFLQLTQCKAAFKALAMLHAGSLAVEIKTGKMMPEHAEHCYEALIADIDSNDIICREWHRSGLKSVFELLQKMLYFKSQLAAVNWDDVHERLEHAWEQCAHMANGKNTQYKKVISHGDLWVNNVLFRHLDVMLVDFQIYRYVPPAIDLLMLLHLTTSRQLRRGNQSALIEFYYNCLVEYLAQAGIQEEELPLSLEQLLKSAQDFKVFGIVIAARYLQVVLLEDIKKGKNTDTATVLRNDEDCVESEITGSDLILKAFATGKSGRKFEARMVDCLNDLLEHLQL